MRAIFCETAGLYDDGWKAVFANYGGFKPPLHEGRSATAHPHPW
jgi:hypothetical protein